MKYQVQYTDIALEDLKLLKKHEPDSYKKALKLIAELYEHPLAGTGHPEPLKGNRNGQWSRRINQKHRLVYKVENDFLRVLLISAYGHCDDR